MTIDDRAHDREAETETGHGQAGRVARAIEAVEQVRQILLGDADARVGNLDLGVCIRTCQSHGDLPAGRSELERVQQQVVEHLREPVAVAYAALHRLDRARQRDPGLVRAGARQLDSVVHQRGEVELARLQQQRRPIDLGREQQVADESHESARVAIDHFEMASVLGRGVAGVVAQQQLDVPEDRCQRRAQLVRDEREEVLLGALGLALAGDVAHDQQPSDQPSAAIVDGGHIACERAAAVHQHDLVAPLGINAGDTVAVWRPARSGGWTRIECRRVRGELGAHPPHRRVVDDHGAVAVEQRDRVRRRVEHRTHDARAFPRRADGLDQLAALLCQLAILAFERSSAVLERVGHLIERACQLTDLADPVAMADARVQVTGGEPLCRAGDVAQRCEQRPAQIQQEADCAQHRRCHPDRAGDPGELGEVCDMVTLDRAGGSFTGCQCGQLLVKGACAWRSGARRARDVGLMLKGQRELWRLRRLSRCA